MRNIAKYKVCALLGVQMYNEISSSILYKTDNKCTRMPENNVSKNFKNTF